ncbi:MAG: hypothetical protein ACXVB4_16655 [Pseudobdellovibrionaceae bacterium]
MKRILNIFYGWIQLLMIVGFGFSVMGCAKDGGSPSSQEAGETSIASLVSEETHQLIMKNAHRNPHNCVKTSELCFSETFTQPVTTTRAVDVLFVVQTSDSIVPEKQAIVAGIDGFIQSLPANSDFNIAVMLSHGSTSPYSGKLYQVATEPIVLKSKDLTNAQIQTYLNEKLNQVVSDPDSGGGEEGLFSLFNGITTPSLLAASQAQGFFRPDAALGVVFVADRRDICAVTPPGVPAETDPVKINARIRDCEGLTAAGLTSRLHTLKGSLPVAVSGIIYADAPAPAGNEIGYGYTDMIALNAGVAVDIAHDNIAAGLASIAQLSGQQMTIQTEFTLEHDNINPKRIIVTVNGVGATFELNGNKVTITSPIPAGAVVVISYCLKANKDTDHDEDQDDEDKDGNHHHHWKDHTDGKNWWYSHGKKGHCIDKDRYHMADEQEDDWKW